MEPAVGKSFSVGKKSTPESIKSVVTPPSAGKADILMKEMAAQGSSSKPLKQSTLKMNSTTMQQNSSILNNDDLENSSDK